MIAAALIFIVLGIVIKYGKMYSLLAGYNTMPKEQQEQYDIEGIAKVFFNVMVGMALLIFAGYGLAKYTQNPMIEHYAFWASIVVGIPYLLIVTNSKKYKRKPEE